MDNELPIGVPIEGMSWKGKLYIEVGEPGCVPPQTWLNSGLTNWLPGNAAPTQILEALRLWEMEWHLDRHPR